MTELSEQERRLFDREDEQRRHEMSLQSLHARHEHYREVMKFLTKWLPHIVMVSGFVAAGSTLSYLIYAKANRDPCARCLDNVHDAWDCEDRDDGCIESRRHELDRCLTLCPAGTNP